MTTNLRIEKTPNQPPSRATSVHLNGRRIGEYEPLTGRGVRWRSATPGAFGDCSSVHLAVTALLDIAAKNP